MCSYLKKKSFDDKMLIKFLGENLNLLVFVMPLENDRILLYKSYIFPDLGSFKICMFSYLFLYSFRVFPAFQIG